MRDWLAIGLIIVAVGCCTLEVEASGVSVHPFGRYEMILQEGTPVAMGEILGTIRRRTGLPEYPLMLGARKRALELNVLGPGDRPYRLAATQFSWPATGGAGAARFIIEHSSVDGELLTIQCRHASRPARTRFVIDLDSLQRMLEGER